MKITIIYINKENILIILNNKNSFFYYFYYLSITNVNRCFFHVKPLLSNHVTAKPTLVDHDRNIKPAAEVEVRC